MTRSSPRLLLTFGAVGAAWPGAADPALAQERGAALTRGELVVESGGLTSHGPDFRGLSRRSAAHVDKILEGAKPGDLPVEQPTTLELVINRKAAKALGLAMPQPLLLRADRVIE